MLYYLDLFVNNLLLIKIDHIFLKDLTLIKIKKDVLGFNISTYYIFIFKHFFSISYLAKKVLNNISSISVDLSPEDDFNLFSVSTHILINCPNCFSENLLA